MSSTIVRQVIICVFVVMSLQAAVAESKGLVYFWFPRNSDIPADSASREANLLRLLLRNVATEDYVVKKGDNLDFIIRKQFLVSSSLPHAYSAYMSRLVELNSWLKPSSTLHVGMIMTLPSGPKYGGTELAMRSLPVRAQTAAFLRMSQGAYFGPSRPKYSLSSPELQASATRSLEYFVVPSSSTLAPVNRTGALSAIVKRGLVAPISRKAHPDQDLNQVQPLSLQFEDPAIREEFLAVGKGQIYPGFIPADTAVDVSCNGACSTCRELLQIPAGTDVSRARVLVQDTGIDLSMLPDKKHLIFSASGDDGTDVATDRHGTFVYSELASSQKGVIPDSQIYVAKAVVNDGSYSLGGIVTAWQKFANLMRTDNTAANTWVINLSAAGSVCGPSPPLPSCDEIYPLPSPPVDASELLIAAAGNNGNALSPLNDPFDNLSNAGLGLLIVGAVSSPGLPTIYTNFHKTNVQLFAQGDCVCGNPGQISGTSQAAPLVTTAAAILSSANPAWKARTVMWRLLSTTDHPANLLGKAVAGQINLARALGPPVSANIEARSDPITGTAASFSPEWIAAVHLAQQGQGLQVLRFFNRYLNGASFCFSYMEFLSFSPGNVCFPPSASITVSDSTGASQTISVGQLSDITLPVPAPAH